MPEDIAKIFTLLGRMAVFKPLKPNQLEALANDFEAVSLAKDEILFSQGEVGTEFYVVFSGRLQINRQATKDGPSLTLANLVPGDFIGEESLLYGNPRTATVSAALPSVVLRLSYDKFAALIQNYAEVIPYFVATVESRRLIRKTRFSWIGADETIYLLLRKHRSYLLYKLLRPIAVNLLSWIFFALNIVFTAVMLDWIFGLLGLTIFLISLAMGVWEYIDWGNDYYIVTNQRVIWLERVIGLYDSREEAPLGTVVAVNKQSDQVGRMLGYGDISIKLFAGQIVLRHVATPGILEGLLQELVIDRGRQKAKQSEVEAIEQALRNRLNPPPPTVPSARAAPPKPMEQMSSLRKLWADFFKMRYEEGSKVTFRKHWIILFRETLWPNLLMLLFTTLLLLRLANVYSVPSLSFVFSAWLAAMMILSVWWVYGYVDWSNDIYQVTDETIVDIYRKPLGDETKKTAAIESILSVQHSRDGIIHQLLNYGDVIASVGADRFFFVDVFNPSEVEHEIFHRMAQRKRKMRENEIVQQREYIADWLAAYHRQVTQPPSNQPK